MQPMISDKQLDILAFPYTSYDALVCDGAIRSGKTSLMTVAFVDDAMRRYNNQNFIIGGRTVGSAIRNVIDPYRIMSYARSKYALSWNQQKNMLTVTKGGIQNRFYVFGGKDKSSFTLVQGITAAGCLIDEVALCERSFVEQAIARCSVDGSKFWFNCNPGPPDHWFRVEWILNARAHNALHLHFSLGDNPSLTPEIRARYESMYEGVFRRRYIDGEWCVAEGLVYSMWSEDFIQEFVPELDKDGNDTTTYYMSIDYGITNPFVALLWAVSDGRLWAVDEYCFDSRKEGSRRTDHEHYDAIDKFIDGRDVNIIIIDPSANSFKELINRKDKYWYKGGNNDVLSGISKVSSLMGEGRIMVSPRCHELISEMGLYQWQSDTAKDAVVKEHDHAADAMRYLVQDIGRDVPSVGSLGD